MSVFTSDVDERRWFCRSRWHYYLHRPIPNEDTMNMLLGWLSQGADVLEMSLSDAPEDQAREEEWRALMNAQSKSGA